MTSPRQLYVAFYHKIVLMEIHKFHHARNGNRLVKKISLSREKEVKLHCFPGGRNTAKVSWWTQGGRVK